MLDGWQTESDQSVAYAKYLRPEDISLQGLAHWPLVLEVPG